MPHRKSVLLALAALATSALAGDASAPQPVRGAPTAGLPLESCRLEHPQGLTSLDAECGYLTVPENRTLPAGRQIKLFVARVRALSRKHRPEPLFVIPGGPGLGASTFYAGVAPALARIRRDRDIVLVDQRGTGRSAALTCAFDEAMLWEAAETETARVMRECHAQLARAQDPAQYTTSIAVQDLDAVRQALGYRRIALFGSSYGTRVAQHYARRFPAATHALVLDGVVPPTRVLGPSTPLDAEAALLAVFARCRADQACKATFGDPEADYRQLRARLAAAPVRLQIDDPINAEPRDVLFSSGMLAGALRLTSYTAEQAALLPLLLHLANDRGDYAPLAAQYVLAAGSYDSVLAYGMNNTVVCAEDVPFFANEPIDRARLDATFLGTSQLDALAALCAGWPRGPVDADLHAPLESQAPALLLSGSADPVTPAAFGNEAALGFRHALHLTLPGQGHGQLAQPCIDRIMAEFLDASTPGVTPAPDTGCVHKLKPAPFFVTLNGPAP